MYKLLEANQASAHPQASEHELPWHLKRLQTWRHSSLAILLMTANAGHGQRAVTTPFHLDGTEAINIAFGLEEDKDLVSPSIPRHQPAHALSAVCYWRSAAVLVVFA
jgi:hypothetical protein